MRNSHKWLSSAKSGIMASLQWPSHPAGGDRVLEHAADHGGQRPGLPAEQTLHAALSGQQGEVGQTAAAMETEELVAVDSNINQVCETREPGWINSQENTKGRQET